MISLTRGIQKAKQSIKQNKTETDFYGESTNWCLPEGEECGGTGEIQTGRRD